MNASEWGKRVVALVLAAALVVGAASVGAVVSSDSTAPDDEALALPEYQSDEVTVDPIPAEGTVDPDRDATRGSGTVVIDTTHSNRFDRTDIEPIVRGLTRVGYTVKYSEGGNLASQLEDAKAYVVIDPDTEYADGDIDDVRKFTGQGGHLLIVGEPNRIRLGGGLFGLQLTRQDSAVTTLASNYGMTVGTDYLYNQENADANYKFITTEPGPNADIEGVERTTMYTAAPVRVEGGTVLLQSSPNTLRSSTDDETGQYPVAVRRNEVILLGDKSFMETGKYKVADNEEFVTYLVEFLASSDREPGTEISEGGEDDSTDAPGTPPSGTPPSGTPTPTNTTD